MIRHGLMVATIVCFVAVFAMSATQEAAIDGRWQGTMNTANGSVTVTYTFKANGQVLTGTEESPMFSRSISDGKVNADKISFKTTVNGNSIEHEGTVSGNTIQLKNHGPYGEFGMTIERVSSEKKSAQQ
ncbi:MAG TPA: hypothetical protein VGM18_09135 [Candidatus Sulfotelmatobacter sp.]